MCKGNFESPFDTTTTPVTVFDKTRLVVFFGITAALAAHCL